MDAATWEARYADADRLWSETPNRWVHEVLAGRRPGRAIDLACGEGRNAVWLAEEGWEVTAVDFSETALARAAVAASRRGVTVRWVQADVTTWVPPGPVDLVLVAYLHLPAEERRRVLHAAADALAPGGTLLVVGHDSANLTRGVGGPRDPAVLYTAQDVVDDLADTDLQLVRGVEVLRPVSDEPARDAVDALVELRRGPESASPGGRGAPAGRGGRR
ncbi:class I SAM-dependent methyltransferase [Actinomycetospora cinnamomea]|uniref:Methyltransferase family protein n=1 Tax=Actinomycetospora cinnamomea TaxID=663609 RepID=A0A2U1F2L0_9PSEU|nr:class I SAM-dependent methyltransferase [Actinomycetospora cinnamomea]PVZ06369.1 methyltransferase family protein [Actinomycetospora cinnamomea]